MSPIVPSKWPYDPLTYARALVFNLSGTILEPTLVNHPVSQSTWSWNVPDFSIYLVS